LNFELKEKSKTDEQSKYCNYRAPRVQRLVSRSHLLIGSKIHITGFEEEAAFK
jgi:hypothetical protein